MNKSWRIELVIIIAIVITSIGIGLGFGVAYSQANMKPEVQIVKKIIEKIVEKPVEVRVEVPVMVEREVKLPPEIIEVEKLIEKTIEIKVPVIRELKLGRFNDEQELEDWLQRYYKTHMLIVSNQVNSVCYLAARKMAESALKDGYFMWVQIIDRYFETPSGVVINRNGKAHAVSATVAGNNYFIEPALNEYWSMYKVDVK